jgi:hypothetical protein
MTREDIIRMAREAGSIDSEDVIETVYAAFSAAERKACVKILEAYQIPIGNSSAGELAAEWTYEALDSIRAEIRDRGNK